MEPNMDEDVGARDKKRKASTGLLCLVCGVPCCDTLHCLVMIRSHVVTVITATVRHSAHKGQRATRPTGRNWWASPKKRFMAHWAI